MSAANETYPPAVMEAIAKGDVTALLIEVYKATSHTAGQVLEHNRAIRGLQSTHEDHGADIAAHERRIRKLEDLESSRRSAEPLLNASQQTEADAIMGALRKVSEDAIAREERSRINTEKADASATRNARLATLRTIVLLVVFAASAWLRNR